MKEILDLVDVLVHREYIWQAAKEQNQNTQEDEAIYGNDVVLSELGPRANRTKPHEDGQIEKHIDCRLQRVVHGLQAEPVTARLVSMTTLKALQGCSILLGKYIASNEAGKKIISPYQTAGPENE